MYKKKKKKYALRGILATAFDIAPTIIDLFDKEETPNMQPNQIDTNPFMRNGGRIYEGGGEFREYDMPSHEQGGMGIDKNLNPTTEQPIAELEKKETTYKDKQGNAYVYSDNLEHKGMTFAKLSKKIRRKYSRGTDIDQKGKELELSKLANLNDVAKSQQEEVQAQQFKYGGKLPMAQDGLSILNKVMPSDIGEDINFSELDFGLTNKEFTPEQQQMEMQRKRMMETLPIKSLPSPQMPNSIESNTKAETPEVTAGKFKGEFGDKKPFNWNTAALIGKGAGLLHSLARGLEKPEQDRLVTNPNKAEAESLMENRFIDFAPLQEEVQLGAQAGLQTVRNVAGNAGTQSALSNKVLSSAARNAANLRFQTQQANNQYRSDEARVKAQLGSEQRSYERETDIANMQNEANRRTFLSNFFSELTDVASQANKYQNYKEQMQNNKELRDMTIREGLTILSGKYANFGISKDMMERLQSGDYSDGDFSKLFDAIIRFKGSDKE